MIDYGGSAISSPERMEDQPPKAKRKFSKQLCLHCDTYVSKSTWYRHYALDQESCTWTLQKKEEGFYFESDSGSGNESTSLPQENDCFDFETSGGEASMMEILMWDMM